MGLLTALNTAASGLRSTQVGLDVVASNVANANSIGYSRRTVVAVQSLAGDRTTGVRSDTIERVLDTALQKQLRLETSGAAGFHDRGIVVGKKMPDRERRRRPP